MPDLDLGLDLVGLEMRCNAHLGGGMHQSHRQNQINGGLDLKEGPGFSFVLDRPIIWGSMLGRCDGKKLAGMRDGEEGACHHL